MSELEYKKLHDEWLRSRQELENVLNGNPEDNTQTRTNITVEQKNECNCIVNKAYDLVSSFTSGLIWIIVILILIGLIFG